MKQVCQIIRILDQGATKPILCKAEDGEVYCCKGINAGYAALCREWVCANIARVLRLPIPEFEILDVPLKLFENWNNVKGGNAPMLVNSGCHYVFGSRIVSGVKDVLNANDLRTKKVDVCTMGRILMFDRMIRNCDRTDWNSNLLMTVDRSPFIYIIDHNLAFDKSFNRGEFMRTHIFRDFYSDVTQEDSDGFRKDVLRIIGNRFVPEVKSQMPEVWLDCLKEYEDDFFENVEETLAKEVK